jgi:hypothetical protein
MEDREKRGRTLEEVSHFFLSGERPYHRQEAPAEPQALPADRDASALTPSDLSGTDTPEEAAPPAPIQEHLCLLFSASKRLADKKSFLACNLALELARQGFSVGLIETTARLPNTFFLFGGYKNINAVFWEKDLNSPDFLTILDRLRRANDFLVMNVSPHVFGPGKMTAAIHPFVLVPTTGHSEDLLNAYALIKQIARDGSCPHVGLVVVGEDALLPAEAVGEIMSEMAQKFLACKIHFMGAIPNGGDVFQGTLTKPPPLQASKDSPLAESMKGLAERLIKNNDTYVKGAGNGEDNQ